MHSVSLIVSSRPSLIKEWNTTLLEERDVLKKKSQSEGKEGRGDIFGGICWKLHSHFSFSYKLLGCRCSQFLFHWSIQLLMNTQDDDYLILFVGLTEKIVNLFFYMVIREAMLIVIVLLTRSWRRFLSYRNQSITVGTSVMKKLMVKRNLIKGLYQSS